MYNIVNWYLYIEFSNSMFNIIYILKYYIYVIKNYKVGK